MPISCFDHFCYSFINVCRLPSRISLIIQRNSSVFQLCLIIKKAPFTFLLHTGNWHVLQLGILSEDRLSDGHTKVKHLMTLGSSKNTRHWHRDIKIWIDTGLRLVLPKAREQINSFLKCRIISICILWKSFQKWNIPTTLNLEKRTTSVFKRQK